MVDETKHVPDGDTQAEGALVGGNIDKNLSGESQPGTTHPAEPAKDITGRVLDGDAADGDAANVKEPSQEQLDEDMKENADTGEGDGEDEDDVDSAG